MTIQALHQQAQESPATISFEQVMTLIDTLYYFTATSFTNGGVVNEAGTN
ncbi:MAG TPA: type III effector, partial [Cellvibrionales bacterium]|nr:type III effector [Cellvibrionales bacterium]HCX27017.1 type III effector [Cellvibrionales bacterium]